MLSDVDKDAQGDYLCTTKNAYGRDSLLYSLRVPQPPPAPQLSVTSTSKSSIRLSWNKPPHTPPVTEFVLFYRQPGGIVQQKLISGSEDDGLIEDLLCGTQYELQIAGRNEAGTGPKSLVLRAMTRGAAPVLPQVDRVTSWVQSTLILHLDHWSSAGCPVHYVRVEKTLLGEAQQTSWNVLSSNVDPDQQPMFRVHDFQLGGLYQLKLTAVSDPAVQTVLYSVQRLARQLSPYST